MARLRECLLTSQGLPSDSTCVLEAKPGKLDIKRHESGILFIILLIVSLFKHSTCVEGVLFLFLTVPWVGLQCVIVTFPGHTMT